jgi:hypothetical protein
MTPSSPGPREAPLKTRYEHHKLADTMATDLRKIVQQHTDELVEAASDTAFVVFLCGPTLSDHTKPSANLRRKIKEGLEAARFDVILGEDDGLEEARLKVGLNAQDNELEFIRKSCNAVVLLADSVGSFCELGLFSWHFAHAAGVLSDTKNRYLLNRPGALIHRAEWRE